MINFLLPTVFGCLIADRLPRDRHTKVEELLIATPGAWGMRLLGKYLGSMSATFIPLLIFYGLGIGFLFYLTGNIQTLPIALAALLANHLPKHSLHQCILNRLSSIYVGTTLPVLFRRVLVLGHDIKSS